MCGFSAYSAWDPHKYTLLSNRKDRTVESQKKHQNYWFRLNVVRATRNTFAGQMWPAGRVFVTPALETTDATPLRFNAFVGLWEWHRARELKVILWFVWLHVVWYQFNFVHAKSDQLINKLRFLQCFVELWLGWFATQTEKPYEISILGAEDICYDYPNPILALGGRDCFGSSFLAISLYQKPSYLQVMRWTLIFLKANFVVLKLLT